MRNDFAQHTQIAQVIDLDFCAVCEFWHIKSLSECIKCLPEPVIPVCAAEEEKDDGNEKRGYSEVGGRYLSTSSTVTTSVST